MNDTMYVRKIFLFEKIIQFIFTIMLDPSIGECMM